MAARSFVKDLYVVQKFSQTHLDSRHLLMMISNSEVRKNPEVGSCPSNVFLGKCDLMG